MMDETTTSRFSVVHSPQHSDLGGMYDWEVWRDSQAEDQFLAGCPSEADASLLASALQDRADLLAALKALQDDSAVWIGMAESEFGPNATDATNWEKARALIARLEA